ncbi:MAG: SRPBCC family protein [Gammaproteobacteria bacterium]
MIESTETLSPTAEDPALRRSPGTPYQRILDTDTRPVPPVLRLEKPVYYGSADIPVDRYIDRSFHEREKERIWKKVWQIATREENIPNVGDVDLYEVAGISIIVVRVAPDSIKAYYNVCLHQGRALVDRPCNVSELRCQFHGFSWGLDGKNRRICGQWDYPQIDKRRFNLGEVRVGTWGGFVFVNMDPDAGSLESYLGDLDMHFERYPLDRRFTAARVAKVMRGNWKTAQEAFMESFHTIATHPQILAGTGEDNTQYDGFENYARAVSPTGVPSPNLRWKPTEEQIAEASFNTEDPTSGRGQRVPDGMSFRARGAQMARERLRPVVGDGIDALCDAELMDSFYFTVFPNFHPWAAYNHIAYRFLPYEDEHEMCVMETWLLAPYKGERPPAAPLRRLGPDDSYLQALELGTLARIFHQDEANIPRVQKGMHSLRMFKPGVTLGVYQYGKIRHFHRLYDRYMGL